MTKTEKGLAWGSLLGTLGIMVATSEEPGMTALRENSARLVGNAWEWLQSTTDKVAQGLTGPPRRALRKFTKHLRVMRWILLLWPFAMMGAALLPPGGAHVVVPIVTLIPLAALAYTLTSGDAVKAAALATTGIAAGRVAGKLYPSDEVNTLITEFENAVKKVIRDLRVIIGVELLLGLCLAWTPVANDRILIISLLVAIAIAACFAGISKNMVGLMGILIVAIFAIWFLGGRANAAKTIQHHADSTKKWLKTVKVPEIDRSSTAKISPPPPAPAASAPAVSSEPAESEVDTTGFQRRHCGADEGNKPGDYSGEPNMPDFTIDFSEEPDGCFAGPFTIPIHDWYVYHAEPSHAKGDYVSLWPGGSNGTAGPKPIRRFYEPFPDSDFNDASGKSATTFYLQGKGSIRFVRDSRLRGR